MTVLKTTLPVLAALALTACSAAEAPPLEDALRPVARASQPSPLSLAIAPLQVEADAAIRPVGEDETWSPVRIDLPKLRGQLQRAVIASGAFRAERVRFLKSLADKERPPVAAAIADEVSASASEGRTRGQHAFAVPPPVDPELILSEAFARGDDLVLSFTVRRHAVRYVGRNGWFWPNLLNFATWIWTAYFVAEESYAAELEIEAILRATGTEAELWQKTYTAAPVLDLDHFDRGWKLTGTLFVPEDLDLENYTTAARKTMPYAVNELAVELAADLGQHVWEGEPGESARQRATTLAVSIGASRYERVQDLRVASDDARAFAGLLTGSGVPARNVVVLDEKAPTRRAVLEAVRERARRGGPGDTLFIYFSGYAFESGGQVYLAPYDLDPSAPVASSISLYQLAGALVGGDARQVIVLDTSFAERDTDKATRTLRRSLLSGLPAAGEASRAKLLAFAKGRTVIAGSGPGSAATELSPFSEDKLGLFTARLVEAAGAAASDGDRDGQITVAEAFAVARRATQRISGQTGLTQIPVLYGQPADHVRLTRTPE